MRLISRKGKRKYFSVVKRKEYETKLGCSPEQFLYFEWELLEFKILPFSQALVHFYAERKYICLCTFENSHCSLHMDLEAWNIH